MKLSEYIKRLNDLQQVCGGDPEVVREANRLDQANYIGSFPELLNCKAVPGGFNDVYGDDECDSRVIVVS